MKSPAAPPPAAESAPIERFRDLTGPQWKSGIAAWLGWFFDGLDMHLYTLVAAPFVAGLLLLQSTSDPAVGYYSSIIQAGFLVGWALGGGFFGRIGDRLGRTRTLCLTVLTYAIFTGLSFFAQTWWHLLIFRFLSALGIGGEWAVGASLLSETWPKRWRPWIAAFLQLGVNLGVLLAVLSNWFMASYPPRYLFLVGVLPAFLVLWIRRSVPEPEEWHKAKAAARGKGPRIADLFRGATRSVTWRVIAICSVTLTAHWAFLFWHQQHLRNLPDVINLPAAVKGQLASKALYMVIAASIVGNFFAAFLAQRFGYRRTIAFLSFGYFAGMLGAYIVPRSADVLIYWLLIPGFFQGIFALFTMYLPPLFPTLLRTTGAGFCYNIGRLFAAGGTVFFGIFATLGDYRMPLLYSAFLFIPAVILSMFLPELDARRGRVHQPVD